MLFIFFVEIAIFHCLAVRFSPYFQFLRSRMAIRIILSPSEQELLAKIQRRHFTPEFEKERIQIVLAAASGLNNRAITAQYGFEVHRVGKWRSRWAKAHQQWKDSDETLRPAMTASLALLWLSDKQRSGRPVRISSDQRTQVAALSLETPEQNGFPVSHWSGERLAHAAILRNIVETISRATVARILKKTTCLHTVAAIGSMPK
jgi:transposase